MPTFKFKPIILIVVLVAVGLLGAWWFFTQRTTPRMEPWRSIDGDYSKNNYELGVYQDISVSDAIAKCKNNMACRGFVFVPTRPDENKGIAYLKSTIDMGMQNMVPFPNSFTVCKFKEDCGQGSKKIPKNIHEIKNADILNIDRIMNTFGEPDRKSPKSPPDLQPPPQPEPQPTPVPDPVPQPMPVPEPPQGPLGSAIGNCSAQQWLAAHNVLRQKNGLPPFQWSQRQADMAAMQAARCVQSDPNFNWSSTNAADYAWSHGHYDEGQNGASGRNCEDVTRQWYSSAGHSPYFFNPAWTHIGCAIAEHCPYGSGGSYTFPTFCNYSTRP